MKEPILKMDLAQKSLRRQVKYGLHMEKNLFKEFQEFEWQPMGKPLFPNFETL
jgi:hypothetical protein